MASKKSSGGDFVLESRHLVGLFLLLVVIFGVVFTLGYLLGRGQYDSQLRAEVGAPRGIEAPAGPPSSATKSKPSPPNADAPSAPKNNSDWDFYHSADPQPAPERLQPSPKPASTPAPPSAAPKPPAASSTKAAKPPKGVPAANSPMTPKGAYMLQVAAVLHQDDALALVQALQQKKFAAIVVPPGPDKYYRVQVGPYPDNQAATKARQELEDKGFKSIIKH